MCAKGEERRLAALRKRQELGGTGAGGKSTKNSENITTPKRPREQTEARSSKDVRDSSGKRVCYVCKKPGHFGIDCHQKKSERTGERAQSKSKSKNPTTKQVQSQPLPPDTRTDPQTGSSPLDYLASSEEEEDSRVNSVRIKDTGSKNQYANVNVQGVLIKGMVDSGADITIIGGDLFKQVATIAKLRKRDFRLADKTPRTFDQKPFVLHGCMDLDITFGNKTIFTPVYIKMDSSTPLLLSEGVCRQLGILAYHPSISVAKKEDSHAKEREESTQASVPLVKVSLIQSVKLLPHQMTQVRVLLPADSKLDGPLLVQPSPTLELQGVHVEEGLVQADHRDNPLLLSNQSGFTLELPSGVVVGTVTEVDVISRVTIPNSEVGESNVQVSQVKATESASILRRKDMLLKLYQDAIDLPPDEKKSFCNLIADYHSAFCLEEGGD